MGKRKLLGVVSGKGNVSKVSLGWAGANTLILEFLVQAYMVAWWLI